MFRCPVCAWIAHSGEPWIAAAVMNPARTECPESRPPILRHACAPLTDARHLAPVEGFGAVDLRAAYRSPEWTPLEADAGDPSLDWFERARSRLASQDRHFAPLPGPSSTSGGRAPDRDARDRGAPPRRTQARSGEALQPSRGAEAHDHAHRANRRPRRDCLQSSRGCLECWSADDDPNGPGPGMLTHLHLCPSASFRGPWP